MGGRPASMNAQALTVIVESASFCQQSLTFSNASSFIAIPAGEQTRRTPRDCLHTIDDSSSATCRFYSRWRWPPGQGRWCCPVTDLHVVKDVHHWSPGAVGTCRNI